MGKVDSMEEKINAIYEFLDKKANKKKSNKIKTNKKLF